LAHILGLDPGSRRVGYGVVTAGSEPRYVASGIIKIDPEQSMPARMYDIFQGVQSLVALYLPVGAAIEEVFMHKNVRSALVLGQARGAILSALGQSGLVVGEYAPRLIKKNLVGYGQADKAQIQAMVMQVFGLQGMPSEDAADALAVAWCHARYQRHGY
jgi:crossover junction endodeoxyribonuclease RuvC